MGLLPMDAQILSPTNDRIFKRLLTSQEPGADEMLIDLTTAIIGRPVSGVAIRNNDLPTNYTEEKQPRLDVNCRLDDGTQIDLEMHASQITEARDGRFQNLKGKSVFYLCGLHSSQSAKGIKRYDKLAQTWQVTFCTYNIFPSDYGYLNSFSLRHDERGTLLTDAIRMVFVELSKLDVILKKPVAAMTDLEKWSIFFGYAASPKCRETVNKVIETKGVLQMAGKLLLEVTQEERDEAWRRSYQMFETDMQSNLATTYDNGFADGRTEEKNELIRRFRALGIPLETISQAAEVSLDYVRALS